MKVLVVGGGLAGLSAAIALRQAGHAVSLVEASGNHQSASISITNRGVDALEALGVLDAVLARAATIEGARSIFSVVRDGAGDLLPVPPPPPRTDTRLPSAVILLRAELTAILRDAAIGAGVDVRIGTSLTGLGEATAHHDLVVGADGLNSTIRRLVFPAAPRPDYTGHMSLRWVLPDGPGGDTGSYMLPDSTGFMALRLRGGQTYLSTGIDMPNRRIDQAEAREIVHTMLERFTAPFARALRDRLDDSQPIIVLPYSWLLIPPPWHRDGVVLIGDAVHAPTAHMAAGGSLTIEDCIVLAEELGGHGSLDQRLAGFTARRAPRTTMVVEASVELLRLQQAGAPPTASATIRARAVTALREPY